MFRLGILAAAAALMAAGCTVHQATAPTPSGPSEFALSLNVTASSDSVTLDGSSAVITVSAHDATGAGAPNVQIRLDIAVGSALQDCGGLAPRTITTLKDGTATSVFTAPTLPLPFPQCSGFAPGNAVTIVATPVGTNYQTANLRTASIRLMPTGVILPPANSPTAAFTMSPTTALMNVPVTFDASASAPGSGASQISSYVWSFGDGTAAGSGRTVTHTFTSQQTFNVTLTVTNDRGISASTSVPTAVATVAAPTPKVVFSPSAPQTGQTVVFNADQSTAATGHTLTVFNWNFGDGATASGVTASHAFATAGTFNVVLSVLDDTGQKGTTSVSVTVSGAGGGSSPTATFTFSPAAPGVNETVFFNASTSTPGAGHTIASYAWTFGDGATGTTVNPSHAYSTAGSYSVQLKVTDDAGQATTSAATTISIGSPPAPTANFTSSPTGPVVGDNVVFDASSSTTAQGQTITNLAWNFGDNTPITSCPGDSRCVGTRIISHAYTAAGTYVVNLVVTDSAGRIGAHSASVIVGTGNPVPVITFSPSAPKVPATVSFDSAGTTTSGGATISTYSWSFPSGVPSSSASPSPNVTWTVAGTYTVRLTVTDSQTRSGTTTVQVIVAP